MSILFLMLSVKKALKEEGTGEKKNFVHSYHRETDNTLYIHDETKPQISYSDTFKNKLHRTLFKHT